MKKGSVSTPVAIALSALGIGAIHLLVRFLGRKVEDEYVEYPKGPTTKFGWLPVNIVPDFFNAIENPLLALPVAAGAKEDPFYKRKAEIVLNTLLDYWDLEIHEPKGKNWEYIDEFVRGPEAMYWHWLDPYEKRNQSLWCGAFATAGFGAAGLKRNIRQIALASTARVQEWLKGSGRFKDESPKEDRRVFADNGLKFGSVRDIRPGDLVVVGKGNKAAGNHIAVALLNPYDLDSRPLEELVPRRVIEAVPRKIWEKLYAKKGLLLIEGNAVGYGPDGSKYEGVVVQFRPTIENREKSGQQALMHAVRFKPEDYDR